MSILADLSTTSILYSLYWVLYNNSQTTHVVEQVNTPHLDLKIYTYCVEITQKLQTIPYLKQQNQI